VETVESKENTQNMLEILKKESYERTELELQRLAHYIGISILPLPFLASKKAFEKFDGDEK